MTEPRTWAEIERMVGSLPRSTMVGLAARSARRVLPAIAALAEKYGPEAWEWLNAAEATVRVAEAFARGEVVSRFTLTVGSELSRAAAVATASAARTSGPSPLIEPAEMALAAAAFAADAARSESDARAVQLVIQSARSAAGGGPVPPEQAADLNQFAAGQDPGPLWPGDAPVGWEDVWREFKRRAVALPRLIELPAGSPVNR